MSQFFSQDEIQNATINYQRNPSNKNGEKLGSIFVLMIESMYKYLGINTGKGSFLILDSLDVKKDLAYCCFDRVNHFKPEKGSAFNYFTTVVLMHIRQLRAAHVKSLKRQELYDKFTKFSKSN